MRALLAIARVTVAEAVRSRVALGLGALLALAIAGLAARGGGDGSEAGRARALLSAGVDVTWALLALAAVFLATSSVARELEDGRAVPVAVTAVSRTHILLGKWVGLGAVLALVLALSLGAVAGIVLARARLARQALAVAASTAGAPASTSVGPGASGAAGPSGGPRAEDVDELEREVLTARAVISPAPLETSFSGRAPGSIIGGGEPAGDSQRALSRARERLAELEREGRIPRGTRPDDVLARLVQEEVVRALSVSSGRSIEWTVGPLPPAQDAPAVALRYKYRVLGSLPPGKGPRGTFSIEAPGFVPLEKAVSSTPDYHHELPAPGALLETPVIRSPLDGTIDEVRQEPGGARLVVIGGTGVVIPQGFALEVAAHRRVQRGDALARSDRVVLRLSYRNVDPSGVVVVFPPEGPELLYAHRSFLANVGAAFLVLLGRLLFLLGAGLGLATLLDGKVAALATLFVLLVAAGHGFLDDAVGPILAAPADNVFGALDVPVKALLRAVLFLLPDLGRGDPAEALASGRVVQAVAGSLGVLGLFGGGLAALAGGLILERRELGGGRS